jgi:hypothetical protein
VKDDEYISHGEDIATFLTREIAKPIIRLKETKNLSLNLPLDVKCRHDHNNEKDTNAVRRRCQLGTVG